MPAKHNTVPTHNDIFYPPPPQVPPNTARCKLFVGIGSAKYVPEHNAVVWRVRKFPGGAEVVLNGEIELIMSTKNKAWVRPPISVDFQVRACVRACVRARGGYFSA